MADVESLELEIKGNATDATKSLDNLIETLNKLEKATSGGCGLSKVNGEMKKLNKVSIGVRSSIQSTSASFAKLTAKAIAAYHALDKIGDAIMSCIQKSSEYTENMNLFSVSMGEYASSAMEYANTVSEALGIDPSVWIRNQGVFMTMATGFGVATDRAALMSQQLTQLGYDISSFYNISVQEAMTKLQSGLSGELEPLRQLGYDLSQAKLEATALSLGIDKSVNSMTQAEKAQLRYYAIMTQVTDAHGDMARTLDAPANQLRILKAQVEQAARSIGNIFIPVLNKVLPYLIAAAKVVRHLADAIAGLFGYEIPEIDYSNVSGLSDSAGDASDSIEEATDSVKKLKKMLLGIDELNVMADTSSPKDTDTGGWVDFELPTYDFIGDSVANRVDEIVEKMKEWLGITDEIDSWSDLFDTRLGKILTVVGLIGGGIALWKIGSGIAKGLDVVSGVFGKLKGLGLGKIVGDVGAFFELLKEGNSLGDVLSAAFPKISGFFANIPGAILGGIAGIAVGVPTFITGLYKALTEGLDWLNGTLIAAGATATGAGIGAIIGGPIGAGIGALIGLAVGLITDFTVWLVQNWDDVCAWFSDLGKKIGGFFSECWEDIQSVWSTVCTWFNTKVIQPVTQFFTSLWESIVNVWNGAGEWFNTKVIQPVTQFFTQLWQNIVSVWDGVVEWFDTTIFTPLYNTVKSVTDWIGTFFEGCWIIIQAVWIVAGEWFATNVIEPVRNWFEGATTAISNLFYSAWEGVQAVWASVTAWFSTNVTEPIRKWFEDVTNAISDFFSNAWKTVKTTWANVTTWFTANVIEPIRKWFEDVTNAVVKFFSDTWDKVRNTWSTVSNWFQSCVLDPIRTKFHDITTRIGQFFSEAWGNVTNAWKVATAWFGDTVIDPVVQRFQNAVQKIRTAFENGFTGIKNFVKSIFNGVIECIEGVINRVITGFNNLINRFNNVVNWAADIVGTDWKGLSTLSLVSIPRLADGGMVNNSGQLFIAREAGPELVGSIGNRSAVANNDQIVSAVSQGVYQAVVQAMSQSSGNQTVEAKVNDKVLFEVVVNRARQETVRKGFNPLLGGV